MTLAEKIAARTMELIGETDSRQQSLVRTVSTVYARMLQQKLRPDTEEEVLVSAGSLLALADYLETAQPEEARRFTVGDVTVENRDSGSTAEHLRRQVLQMTAAFRGDSFRFQGVQTWNG